MFYTYVYTLSQLSTLLWRNASCRLLFRPTFSQRKIQILINKMPSLKKNSFSFSQTQRKYIINMICGQRKKRWNIINWGGRQKKNGSNKHVLCSFLLLLPPQRKLLQVFAESSKCIMCLRKVRLIKKRKSYFFITDLLTFNCFTNKILFQFLKLHSDYIFVVLILL